MKYQVSSSHTKRDVQRRKTRRRPRVDKRIFSTNSKGGEKRKDIKKVPRKPITGWRLWLFRIIALTVIPTLLFLLLEITLRVVGYGFPAAATVKCELDGKDAYCNNIKFGWRFFPRNISRDSVPFIFPADKPHDTYRIFILGASAAQGVPDSAFCFGRFLQVMLRQRYPQVNFEVINIAMAAINSHVVLQIAKDCARHDADLLIVYLGNNEVVGPYGAGTVFAPLSTSLSLIRFGIALKATKLVQLLTNLSESTGAKKNMPAVWEGMEMFLEKQVRATDRRLETVYQHFQKNLEDISRVACKGGAKTVFCTVGSNLKDCPPFASLHRADLSEAEKKKWEDIYKRGETYETADNYAQAVERYLAAAEIDDCYAELQFRLGRCYWAMGEYDKAQGRYVKARELDTLRFRADNRINKIIRDVAGDKAAQSAYLVDAVKVFEENSPHKTAGEELFYEHVHFNFKGSYLLAKTVFKQVEEILPEWVKRQKADKRPLLSEQECAEHLAYTDWDRYKIAKDVLNAYIKQAPFTNQLYHDERVRRMEQKLKDLKIYLAPEALKKAQAQYRQAIQKAPSDWRLRWKYGKLLAEDLKDYRAAAEQYRLFLEHIPHSYTGCTALGQVLVKLGDIDGAIAQYREAIRIKSGNPIPHYFLAQVYRKQGRTDKAIEYYSKTLQILPTHVDAYFNLGLTYQTQGRLDKAIEQYSEALRLRPNHAKAYNNLAISLYQQSKLKEAVQTYRRGLLVVPDDLKLHYNLAILLEKQGHKNEAIKELRAALQIDPNSIEVRKMLEDMLKRGY